MVARVVAVAILHGLNPLHTSLLWAPSGYSTTWITSVPVLALLAWFRHKRRRRTRARATRT